MNKETRAFTLIELLVVIAVLGVLTSIVLINLYGGQVAANDSRIKTSMSQTRSIAFSNNADPGRYTAETCSLIEISPVYLDITESGGTISTPCEISPDETNFCFDVLMNNGETWCTDSRQVVQGSCSNGSCSANVGGGGGEDCSGFPVGEECGGGIVAYRDGGGGIISSKQDASSGYIWSDVFNVEIETTSVAIGSGYSNTQAIIQQNGHSSSAAKICNDLSEGGYGDWFLPSLNELEQLYINQDIIGGFNKEWMNDRYWSSTESTSWDPHLYAAHGFFGDSFWSPSNYYKSSTYKVRCVRSF